MREESQAPKKRSSDMPIKYLGVVISILTILQGYKIIDEWVTPEQAAILRQEAIASTQLNSAVVELTRQMNTITESYQRINDSLVDFGKDMAVTMANYGLRIESLELGVQNHWNAPHPDNTNRAIQNSEKNIEQDKELNELGFRVQRVEERLQ